MGIILKQRKKDFFFSWELNILVQYTILFLVLRLFLLQVETWKLTYFIIIDLSLIKILDYQKSTNKVFVTLNIKNHL